MLLFITLCLQTGYNSAAKKLSVDVGGAKRLHALSTIVATMLLAPWAAFVSYSSEVRVCNIASPGPALHENLGSKRNNFLTRITRWKSCIFVCFGKRIIPGC